MKKSRFIVWVIALVLTLGTAQSCSLFNNGCDCPSPHSGKRR